MKQTIRYLTFLFFLMFLISGCKSNNSEEAGQSTKAVKSLDAKLSVNNAWIRPANSRTNTALFFNIINNTETNDTIYKATSDLAEIVEIHETYKKTEDIMGMRHVDFVEIPAGSQVEFKPRGLHVMFIRLYNDLTIPDSGDVNLYFKKAGVIKITAKVKDMPPMNGMQK